MKIKYPVLFALCFWPATKALSQDGIPSRNWVVIDKADITRGSGSFTLDMSVGYGKLWLERNQQLKLTPIVILPADTIYMEPVYFKAENRAKEDSMTRRFDKHTTEHGNPPYGIVVSRRHTRGNPRAAIVAYSASHAYEHSMGPGRVILREELSGCCLTKTYDMPIGNLPSQVMPLLTYIVPKYDTARTCYLELMASVNFKVDKSVIETRFEHNDEELELIYDFIDKAMNSGVADVKRFRITGYASPEASYAHNEKLSSDRVNSLKQRLMTRYDLPADMFSVATVPEDWDSLKRWVADSRLRHAGQVIEIIDNTSDPDARDAKIKAIDNGETYRILLDDAYPNLRRTEVRACYDLPVYTEAQIWDIIENNPDFLSLRDIYMLSGKLDPASAEYERLYDIALKRYPDDDTVLINASSIAIRNGDKVRAAYLLAKVSGNTASYNNIGVLYALSGDPAKASEFLGKAVASGNTDAADNLEKLDWLALPQPN